MVYTQAKERIKLTNKLALEIVIAPIYEENG